MEEWENLVTQYRPEDSKTFENAVQIAQNLITSDLAPFEIDCFLETLLLEPVALLGTVSAKRREDGWLKVLEKAFSLLSDIIQKFANAAPYYEDINQVCNLTYPAHVAAKTLECLAQLVRRYRPTPEAVQAHVDALIYNETCKAPRVYLLGVLCEYHPDLFTDITTLWRTFINMVDGNSKVTLNIVKAVLEAVLGLLKNFGPDLVVWELYEFFDKMRPLMSKAAVDEGRTRRKCHELCCTILERHSPLFAERVAADAALRGVLWETLGAGSRAALLAVYSASYRQGAQPQRLTEELASRAVSGGALARYTALRALTSRAAGDVGAARDVSAARDVIAAADVTAPALERRLGSAVTYEDAEAISWCIHANVPGSARLLQAAILSYDALPASVRTRTVVCNILEAPVEIRKPALIFLIAETCTTDDTQRDKLMWVWKDLFGYQDGTDVTLRHSQTVLEDYLEHVVFLLEKFLEEEAEELPSKISSLLKLTAYILNTQDCCNALADSQLVHITVVYVQRYPSAAAVCVGRAAGHVGGMEDFYKHITMSGCVDEEHLMESCLALVEAPSGLVDGNQVLLAAETLLSKSNTESKILSKMLKQLENMILDVKEKLDNELLYQVIGLVEKRRKRHVSASKDDRILHRDLLMFLGKFLSNDVCTDDRNPILRMDYKELYLNIPFPHEGITLKLNLQDVLEQAIEVQDADMLWTLITIICANSRRLDSESTCALLSRAAAARARYGPPPARWPPAARRAAAELLPYIVKETSPQARRILLEVFDTVLTSGSQVQISEVANSIISTADELCNKSQTRLDLLSPIIRAMKENSILSQKYLPRILIVALKTQHYNTNKIFNEISEIIQQKITLFDSKILSKLIFDVFDCLCDVNYVVNRKSKILITQAVTFMKKLYDLNSTELPDMGDVLARAARDPRPQVMGVLCAVKRVFVCDTQHTQLHRQFVAKNCMFFDKFFDFEGNISEGHVTRLEAILDFVATYAEVLLDVYYEKTLVIISRVIETSTPKQIQCIYKSLTACLSALKHHLKSIPQELYTSAAKWFQGLNLTLISVGLSRWEDGEWGSVVQGLKCMLDVFGVEKCGLGDVTGLMREWLGHVRGGGDGRRGHVTRDVVAVCLAVLPPGGVGPLVITDDREDVLQFCRTYISVFSEFFTMNPNLLGQEWIEFSILLNDIVQYRVKRSRDDAAILDLVEKLWPTYETRSTFREKEALLLDLSCLSVKLSPASGPMRWLLRTLGSDATHEDNTRLVALVPGADEYSEVWRRVAASLPARVSELSARPALALQQLLDTLAASRHAALLGVAAALADGDVTKGWWDAAFEDCMRSIAPNADMGLLGAVYTSAWSGRTLGVCERLLIPLLRYIPPSLCEEFFSSHLEELFAALKKVPRDVTAGFHQKTILDYTRAFSIITIAFEKIPKTNLESPDSRLYMNMSSKVEKSHYLAVTVCMLAAELRTRVKPPGGAGEAVQRTFRQFHCANYNCMSAALCCKAPKVDYYSLVFDLDAWRAIVDHRAQYNLPITVDWKQQTTLHAVSIDVDGERAVLSAGTRSRSVTFLRTLSEDPFLYDIQDVVQNSTVQQLELVASPLNQHECAATLTALVRRAAALPPAPWRPALCAALADRARSVSWLLAQIICNCKQELRPHAAALRPALLTLISNTEENQLNKLHVEILKTLIYWREEQNALPEECLADFNNVIRLLVLTIKNNMRLQNIVTTLLEKLHHLSEMYAPYVRVCVSWFDTAASGCVGASTKQIELKILKVLAKNKVDMAVMMAKILENFERLSSADFNIELPRLLGAAMATLGHAGEAVRRFRAAVVKASSVDFVKIVYYTQMGYPACCDQTIIRKIVDLVHKIPGKEKQKCLDIIALYLSCAKPGQHVNDLFDMLDICNLVRHGDGLNVVLKGLPLMEEGLRRRLLGLVATDRRGTELDVLVTALEVTLSKTDEPPSKRRLVSPLLSDELRAIVSRVAAGLTGDVVARVADCLSVDPSVRLFEAFLIAVYHPVTSPEARGDDPSLALELFFHQLRTQEAFKKIKLREEPLEAGDTLETNVSKGSTKGLTQAVQGMSISGDPSATTIDVQIATDEILQTILQFAKRRPAAARSLLVQAWRAALRGRAAAVAAEHLPALLRRRAALPAARAALTAHCADGFKEIVEKLLVDARGTEGYGLVETLHQEVMLTSPGLQQFTMGSRIMNEDEEMTEARNIFSIKDLVASFGMLTDWEDLTIGQKRTLSKNVPILWTDRDTFKDSLEEYEGGVPWFDAMLAVYCNEGQRYRSTTLLKQVDAWPRNSFDVAAVTEAIEWQYIRDVSHTQRDYYKLTTHIHGRECLAKWSARLMLRRLFLKKLNVDSQSGSEEGELGRSLSLSHQLQWCMRANEMEIPALALQCLADVGDMYESETLKWLQQKMMALRTMGLQRNDSGKFQEALSLYEFTRQYREVSTFEDIIGIEYWRLVLLKDLNALSLSHVQGIITDIEKSLQENVLSKEFRQTLDCIYVFIMTSLDNIWEETEEYDTKCDILLEMAKALNCYAKFGMGSKRTIFADVIIRRVDCDKKALRGDVSAAVLEVLTLIREELDDFALDMVRANEHKFAAALGCDLLVATDHTVVEYKQMLSLVADPAHSLLQYCCGLQRALQDNDQKSWMQTFKQMKAKIFENPYVGTDYRVLFQHKSMLYNMEEFAPSADRLQRLSRLSAELSVGLQTPQSRQRRLQQLCPRLCERDAASDLALARLLRLPAHTTVEFDETVSIYTDSVRRAAVLTVSVGGRAMRRLVKGGEPLRGDAAGGRCSAALALLGGTRAGGYWVTQLSEDCGLIQYLEHHDRVRNLILSSDEAGVAGISSSVPRNDNQILSRKNAMEQFEQCCSKVPATLLRSAIERNSANLEDFISKKSRFVESLSGITVVNWLLGVGDRHLENIMYNYADGTVCNIDWGGALQYGAAELPCARLTRSLLAACELGVLESKLQKIVQHLRNNSTLLLAVLEVSFAWREDRQEKMMYMRGLLQGTCLSYQITKDVLRKSNVKYKEKYIELLDEVFQDFENKESYSVEEQVSCLLRQSTDPRILSVTRLKWEPWL